MAFAGINYLAVLIAAVASWLAGAVWYMALAKPWTAAIGMTPEQMLAHLGPVTLRSGVISGLFCWGGFVFTTMLVNNSFAMRSPKLLLIDGGYWLVVLVLSGAIIGALGV